MANYTYEQFQKAAQEAGLWDKFSDADRRLAQSNPDAGMSLLGFKKDYAGAANEQTRLLANAGANGIRKQYGGYSGGTDGSGYTLTGEGNGSFNSAANEQANAMLALLEKREPYSYDAKADPNAQTYRKQYAREGQRATKDTMGAYAAMTGGRPSSAAVTAAQQAGNQYAAQGADKVAELEQLAYSRYQDEGDQMRQKWSMYRDQADAEYNRWLNEKNLQTQAEQLEYDRELQREQLEYERELQREQLEYERAQAEYQRKYNEAVLAAQYGDYRGLQELGIDTSSYMTGGYSYSGGGSGSGSGSGGDDQSDPDLDEVYNELLLAYSDGDIPTADWGELSAAYGEEQLTAWGFKQAAGPDAERKAPTTPPAGRQKTADRLRQTADPGDGSGAGGTQAGSGAASGGAQITQSHLNAMKNAADSQGRINATLYDKMVKAYGEDAIRALGYSRGS